MNDESVRGLTVGRDVPRFAPAVPRGPPALLQEESHNAALSNCGCTVVRRSCSRSTKKALATRSIAPTRSTSASAFSTSWRCSSGWTMPSGTPYDLSDERIVEILTTLINGACSIRKPTPKTDRPSTRKSGTLNALKSDRSVEHDLRAGASPGTRWPLHLRRRTDCRRCSGAPSEPARRVRRPVRENLSHFDVGRLWARGQHEPTDTPGDQGRSQRGRARPQPYRMCGPGQRQCGRVRCKPWSRHDEWSGPASIR